MVGLAEDAPLDEVGFGENVAPAWRKAFFGEVLPTVRDVGSWVGEIQLVNRVTGRKMTSTARSLPYTTTKASLPATAP